MRRAAAALFLAVCAQGLAGTATAQAGGEAGVSVPTLAPGDRVRIEVWRRPEMSGEFPVLGSGGIGHPLYKDIEVVGVPVETVEARLRAYLVTLETDPQFVFVPLLSVAVGGEVRAPAILHLSPETSIAQAVARAGGPTDRAKMSDVRLRRDGQEQRLDLRGAGGDGVRFQIRSGDEIVIGRTSGFDFMQHVFLPVMSTAGTVFSLIRLIDR